MSFFLLKKEQIKFKEGQDWKKPKPKQIKEWRQQPGFWYLEQWSDSSHFPSIPLTNTQLSPSKARLAACLLRLIMARAVLPSLLAGSADVSSWQMQLHLVSAASFVVRNSLQSFRKQEAICKEPVEWATHKPPPKTHGADWYKDSTMPSFRKQSYSKTVDLTQNLQVCEKLKINLHPILPIPKAFVSSLFHAPSLFSLLGSLL